jgi:ABC-type branched-subunit amino acid transport system substrate-binding protein
VSADETAYGQRLAAAGRGAAGAAGIESTDGVAGTGGAFLAMGEVEQAVAMRELRADGYRGELLSAEGGADAPIAGLAGPAAEGAWLLYPGTPVDGRSVYAAEAADAARLLLAAGEGGVAAIRRGELEGETGRIRFAADGERAGAAVSRYRVESGIARLVT